MSKKSKKEIDQLDLKLKQSPLNRIAKYKERFELFRAHWNIKRYTKSTWVWFTIVLSFSMLLTQIYTIQKNTSVLPKVIPLFRIYVDAENTLTPTEYIYIIPILSLLIIIVGIIFSNKYYNKQRNLSNTLLWTMFLGNLVLTLSLIRLINLY
jgi:O-antigen ligase